MSLQLVLRFDEVSITCAIQQGYHSIAPCLAGKQSAEKRADAPELSYTAPWSMVAAVPRAGLPGLFPATDYPREPHTPEQVIVILLYYKCCQRVFCQTKEYI
jgi:hypothetical protein